MTAFARRQWTRALAAKLGLQRLEDRVTPHGPGFAGADVPFGVFTPEEIEAFSIPIPQPNFSTNTPPPSGLPDGGHQSDTLTIVLDFKESTQPNTSDLFGNVVSSFDVTSYGFSAASFDMVAAAIAAEVDQDFFSELLGTVAGPTGKDLAIDFVIGDIGTPPAGVTEYYYVQIGTGVSGPHSGGTLGVAGGSAVRNSGGTGPNFGVQTGDVVASVFTDAIVTLGGLSPSNALTSGNLEFTTFAVSGTLSHEIGHTVSLSHINVAGSVQVPPGIFPIMGTGAIDLPNSARITDRTFSLSGIDGENSNAPRMHVQQLVDAIGLHDTNNNPPVITSNGGGATASINLAENMTAVTTVTATDADAGAVITYSITAGADASLFTIDSKTGVLAFAAAPNFENPLDAGKNNVYDVTVTASDGTDSDTQDIAVTITDVPEAPVITSNGGGATASVSLIENTTAVTTVTVTDEDAGTTITYSLDGADKALFSINSSGVLTFNAAPDFETPADANTDNKYEVTVKASDGSLIDEQAITVAVSDVNEAPTITSDGGGATASVSIPENTTAVTTVTATDPDAGATITYSITGGADKSLFSIDSATGKLSFVTAPNFESPTDANTDNVYDVTVRASDGTLFDDQSISTTVTDVNESPVITSNGGGATASVSVAENSTAVTTVTVTDPDAGTTITYTLSGDDAARFTINSSGVLTFATAPDFEAPSDLNADNKYEVTVKASDGSLFDEQAITVTVTDLNDNSPIITSNGGGATASVSVAENTTAITTVTATDADAGTTFTYSISGGADSARFSIDSATGKLSFAAAPNFENPLDAGADNVYDVVVTASDGANSDTQAIAVTVTDVPEAPIITSNGGGATASVSVAENTTAITTVTATDDEGDTITYSLTGGADNLRFSIDSVTGKLTFVVVPNFEAPTDADLDNKYEVTVRATSTTLFDEQAITVTVTDVNEFSPVITSDGAGPSASITLAENIASVTTVTATDGDTADTITYSISGGADAALFTIDSATGKLAFAIAPSFETPADANTDNVYLVTVRASDGSTFDEQALSVTITDVNEFTPVITSDGAGATASVSTAENTTAVTTVTATDGDTADTVTYSISGGADAGLFTIDSKTGVLTFLTAPNFEVPTDAGADNKYEVTVRASDGTTFDEQAITVTVTDVNETPVITSNGAGATATVNVPENTTTVTTVTATDEDTADTITYSIVAGADKLRFSINPSTGVLIFVVVPNFEAPTDSNLDNMYEVTVRASDGSLFDDQTITVAVTDTNDNPPVITSNGGDVVASVSIVENTTAVTTVTATDADAGTMISYSISGGADSSLFTIDSSTGVLSFITAPNFEAPTDAGANNVYDVSVRASDGLFFDEQAVSVTVTDTNDAPVITSDGAGATASVSAAENQTAVTTVTVTDEDTGATITYSLSGDDAAFFSISPTGVLSFISAPDFESPLDADANNKYEVTVTASDGTLTDAQAITVTVTDTNDNAPVITSNGGGATASVSVVENTSAVTTVTATDVDTGTTFTYSLSGDDAGFFTINSSGVLTFAASPDFEAPTDKNADNNYEVTVRVSDGVQFDEQSITVTVTDTNEAPVITSDGGGATASVSVNENTTAVTTVTVTDPDAGTTIAYTLDGADKSLFSINSSGVLVFVSAPNFEIPSDANGDNKYEVTVRASDGSLFDEQALIVTVADVNEAPVITSNGGGATASVSVAENTSTVTTVTVTDVDAGSTITYTLSGTDAALFTINASGVLTFVTPPDFETPADVGADNVYNVTVRASDSSLFDEQDLAVTVTNVSDVAPVITSDGGGATASVSRPENSTAVTTVTATDVESADVVSYSIAGGADAALFAIDSVTGVLTFLTAPNFEVPTDAGANNVYDVTVKASDGTNFDLQDIAVTITDVSEAPVITSNGGGATASISVAENMTVVTTVTATDPDAGTTITYSLSGPDAGLFLLNPSSGFLTFANLPNFENPLDANADNKYEITVTASDSALTDTQDLTVTVTDANDGPNIVSNGGGEVGVITLAENTTAVTTVIATDEDAGAIVTYSIFGEDAALFSIDPTSGVVAFLVAPDFEAPTDKNADNLYAFTVIASDGTAFDTQALEITVTDANEAPTITSNGGGATASVSIVENTTAVTSVMATDPDAGTTFAFSVSGPDAAIFTIDSKTGVLAFATAPDFEVPGDANSDNVYEVTVIASDGSLSDAQDISVSVTNENEAPVITSDGGEATASVSVEENIPAVTTVTVVDPDAGTTIVYTLSGPDAALFTISPTGALTFVSAPDFEIPADANLDNVYQVTVTASDGTLSDTQDISVSVTDANDNAPVITSNGGGATASVSVAENTTAVTTVTATDADAGTTIVYTLSGPDAARFTITSGGVLTFATAPDFETPTDANLDNVYLVTVTASDGALFDTQDLTVTVTDLNDNAPVITSDGGGATATVIAQENSTTVTTVIATDADAGTTITYSITGGSDAAFFAIDSSTGKLSFMTAPDFETPADANLDNVYDVTVTASDGTLVDTQAISVTVADVDEPPVITSDGGGATASLIRFENALSVTTVTAVDPEGVTPITYGIAGGADAALFTIDPATGQLSFLSAPNFEIPGDADADNNYVVTVSATDGTNLTTQEIAVNIGNANEAPTFTVGVNQTVNEDSGSQTVTGFLTAIAVGPAGDLGTTVSFDVTNDNPGLFLTPPTIDSTGKLVYTLADDAFGSATITVVAMDDGGTLNGGVDTSAPQTFTITVNPVNDAPDFALGGTVTVNEDSGANSVSGYLTALTVGPANESAQIATISATNDNNSLFSVQPTIDASGKLTFTPALNANGTAIVTVTVQDDGGTDFGGVDSMVRTFTIIVNAVNDAPSFVVGANQTHDEDDGAQSIPGFLTAISAGPSDESTQTVSFAVSNDNNALFSVQPTIDASGKLVYTLADNAFGSAIVTITSTDTGGTALGGVDTSAPQTFTITVNPVNDAPTYNLGTDPVVNEDSGAIVLPGFLSSLSVGPANESAHLATISASNDNNGLFSVQPSIDSSGNLTFTPAINANGSATVTVTVQDDGGTAFGGVDTTVRTFTITVNAVNDAPSFALASANASTTINTGPQTLPGFANGISAGPVDESGQTVQFLVTNDNNALFTVQPFIDASGTLQYTAAPDTIGVAIVTVVAMDDGGTAFGGDDTSDPQTFTITVLEKNVVPSFVVGADQTVNEDSGAASVSGFLTAISVGPPVESAQTITFLVTNDNNALFAVQPAIDANGQLMFTPADNFFGTATVTVIAKDDGGTANGGDDTSDPQTFTITVNPVNDVPTFTVGGMQTVLEDDGAKSVTAFLTGISVGPANESGQTVLFTVTTDNPSLFAVPPAIDAKGKLTYTLAAEAFGNATMTVIAQDNGGTANGGVDTSASQSFVITVTPVNDAPSFTVSNLTVNEDAGPQFFPIVSNLKAGPANEIQTISFTTSATNLGLFAEVPAVDSNGNVSYTPAANANGTSTVTVTAKDSGGTANGGVDTAVRTFTITITAVNDPPTFEITSKLDVAEDAGTQSVSNFAFAISTGPADEAGQPRIFTVTPAVTSGDLAFSQAPAIDATGTLTFTTSPNTFGSATVTVQLSDDNGGTATQTFVLNVNPVNDPPTATVLIPNPPLGGRGQQTVPGAIALGTGAANETDPLTATVSIVSTTGSLTFTTPPAVDVNGTLTYTPVLNTIGTAKLAITVSDGSAVAPTQFITISVDSTGPTELVGYPEFAVGSDLGLTSVSFFNQDQSVRFLSKGFPGTEFGARVASADFTRDGVADLVIGSGVGRTTLVQIIDGVTQKSIFSIQPFESSFTGGVYVAAGDLNNDGFAELVITPDEGGGPRVRIFDGQQFNLVADFFGIDDVNFRGGARSALGDLNGDGAADLVVAAGFGGGPRIAAFDGLAIYGNQPVKLFNDFFAFEQTLRNGVFVAVGDINGDGISEVIAGGGPGGGPRVVAFDGLALVQSGGGNLQQIVNFFAGNPDNRGGIRLGVRDLDNDNKADLIVGDGTGAGNRVTAYTAIGLLASANPAPAFSFDAFDDFVGGVYVG